jgi:hypothetical protein
MCKKNEENKRSQRTEKIEPYVCFFSRHEYLKTYVQRDTKREREKATVCLARPTKRERKKKDDNNSKKKKKEREPIMHTHTHQKWHSRRSERKVVVEQ